MVKNLKISGVSDIRELNEMATEFPGDVGIHTGTVIVDAKSLLALLALDYSKKVMCVTEDGDERFFRKIKNLIAE